MKINWEKIGFGALVFVTVWFVGIFMLMLTFMFLDDAFDVGPLADDCEAVAFQIDAAPECAR